MALQHQRRDDLSDEGFVFKLYQYDPSLPAAIVTVAAFAILTAIHVWRLYVFRSFYFTAFTIGGVFQVLGYSGRVWSHFDQEALGGFIMQAILVLVAPALYAASIYMTLGRLIQALHAEHLSYIPVKWLTKIFVTGDVISFALQAGGGGIQSGGSLDMFELGEKIIVAGLFIQIVIFSVFVFTSATVHYRVARTPTSPAEHNLIPWKRHLYALYATSALILIRSVFRVIEYLQGNGGYLISHEIFLYIFDAILMAAVMAIFAIWYIGDLKHDKAAMYALSSISRASLVADNAPQQRDIEHGHGYTDTR